MLTRSISARPVSASPPGLIHSSFSQSLCQPGSFSGAGANCSGILPGRELPARGRSGASVTPLFSDSRVIVKVLGKQTEPAVIKDGAGRSGGVLGGAGGGGSSGVGVASAQRGRLGSAPKSPVQAGRSLAQAAGVMQGRVSPVFSLHLSSGDSAG